MLISNLLQFGGFLLLVITCGALVMYLESVFKKLDEVMEQWRK
jgi:hypothetical protein